MNHNKNGINLNIAWTGKDIIFVTLFVYICYFLLIIIYYQFFRNNIWLLFIRYILGLLMFLCPIYFLKKKYNIPKRALGLAKGKQNICLSSFIGVFLGIIFFILFLIGQKFFFDNFSWNLIFQINKLSFLHFVMLPFNIHAFPSVVLQPLAEETLTRGFIYAYLRKRLGASLALLLQALIFVVAHNFGSFDFFEDIKIFILGIALGYLYEKTGTLYPSIAFHASFNYLATLLIGTHGGWDILYNSCQAKK